MKQPFSKTKAILHPIRAQIIVALHDRPMTPRQIAAQIETVPLGTVYRHINLLLSAGLIEVVRERRVYGTIERQFALKEAKGYLTEEEREQLTGEDIVGLVSALTGVVQAAFARYVRTETMPPEAGEIAFVVRSLYLKPDEYEAFRTEFTSLLGKAGRQPSPEYIRRLIGFFTVPDCSPPLSSEEANASNEKFSNDFCESGETTREKSRNSK